MAEVPRRDVTRQSGFTLIELLVVVLIIGILAAIAIPAFLGQKKGAQDSNAKSLIRNAAIAMESYYSENQSFDSVGDPAGTPMTPADVAAIEPNINWVDSTTMSPPNVPLAKDDQVFIAVQQASGTGASNDMYLLQTQSASGTFFSYERDQNAATAKCKDSAFITTLYEPASCGSATNVGNW